MFKNLFNPDSPLMITMSHITDCIFLSLFWILGCFPVVTIGAGSAALYDSIYRGCRGNEKNSWQRFFHVFKTNLKSGILPTVVFLLCGFGLVKGIIALWNGAVYEQISWTIFSAGTFVGVLAVGVLSVLFPMLSRFENTTAGLLKNTVILAMGHLPRTLAVGFVNTACALLCLNYIVPLFFLPGVAALIDSFFIEPMFRPYMPVEDTV